MYMNTATTYSASAKFYNNHSPHNVTMSTEFSQNIELVIKAVYLQLNK